MFDQDDLPDPGELSDHLVTLELREIAPAIPSKGWVPAYHFTIARVQSREPLGLVSLRVGNSDWLQLYAGHVGFAIAEAHRGNRYAYHALRLVAPFAWSIGIVPLWITCNPDDFASRRTCERAGGRLIEVVPLPPGNDMYERGDRFKCRYQFLPPEDVA